MTIGSIIIIMDQNVGPATLAVEQYIEVEMQVSNR